MFRTAADVILKGSTFCKHREKRGHNGGREGTELRMVLKARQLPHSIREPMTRQCHSTDLETSAAKPELVMTLPRYRNFSTSAPACMGS